MKVRATKRGYYGYLRDDGDVFEIESEDHLGSWMKIVPDDVEVADKSAALAAAPPSGGGDHDVADTTETLSVSGLGVTLEEAIKIAMENGDVGASGVPLVSKLKELTGRDVTAAERDEIIDG